MASIVSPTLLLPTDRTKALSRINQVLGELSEVWTPHPKQVDALSALLIEGKTDGALEWGRRTGKSDTFIVAAGVFGQLVPSSQSYLFGPLFNQVKEIYWSSGKIHSVLPANWIDDEREQDMRVWWSGSPGRSGWFKMDGVDNYDRRRGIEPRKGIVLLDEVREMKKGFLDAMNPIRAKWFNPQWLASTPPDQLTDEDDPTQPHWVLAEFDRIAASPRGYYSHATSFDNPHLSSEFLLEEEEKYRKRGELDVFNREYRAKRVVLKKGKKFPMLDVREHQKAHAELMAEVNRERDKLDWFCLTDPAGGSVWAWNFIAIHRWTKRIYLLDEIDETDQGQMTTSVQWGTKVYPKLLELHPEFNDWQFHYDEAETWFANEMQDKFDVPFYPSEKTKKSKTEGFNMFKDALLAGQVSISDRCLRTWWELENYINEKSRDHHCDLIRYFLNVSNYDATTSREPDSLSVPEQMKRDTVANRHTSRAGSDWTKTILGRY